MRDLTARSPNWRLAGSLFACQGKMGSYAPAGNGVHPAFATLCQTCAHRGHRRQISLSHKHHLADVLDVDARRNDEG